MHILDLQILGFSAAIHISTTNPLPHSLFPFFHPPLSSAPPTMNGSSSHLKIRRKPISSLNGHTPKSTEANGAAAGFPSGVGSSKACFKNWTMRDVAHVAKHHRIPCLFAAGLLFFMGVEYTLLMVPSSAPPFDLGFVATRSLHRLLASWPELNTVLAGLNTVFVGMQTVYILWSFLMEGRPRPTIATVFMFTCRGILGYSTQLPLPEEFLGSGADFPVGNVSFFLFFSGHVAGSVIASLDMRRMQRLKLARTFDVLNVLQVVRLLGTRGHYTIDLAVGVGAGLLFDSFAGEYVEESKRKMGLASAARAKELSYYRLEN